MRRYESKGNRDLMVSLFSVYHSKLCGYVTAPAEQSTGISDLFKVRPATYKCMLGRCDTL